MLDLTFSIPGIGHLNLIPKVPVRLSKYKIAGSQARSASGAYGSLLIQQVDTTQGTALLFAFVCDEDTELCFSLPSQWIKLHIALRSTFYWELRELKRVIITEDYCNLYFVNGLQGKGIFRRRNTYLAFDIFFSASEGELSKAVIETCTNKFPYLSAFFDSIKRNFSRPLLRVPMPMTPDMRKTITRLLFADDPKEQQILYPNLVENLILNFLLHAEKRFLSVTQTTDMEKLQRAEQLVSADLTHPPNTALIAKKVRMSESKLRKSFAKVFNWPVKAYWQRERMKQAAELLITTNTTVSAVASQFGFETTTAFIQAFTKQYGQSPGQWRKNRPRF